VLTPLVVPHIFVPRSFILVNTNVLDPALDGGVFDYKQITHWSMLSMLKGEGLPVGLHLGKDELAGGLTLGLDIGGL